MILEVLEAEEPAVFRQELFNTLEHYYEEILGLPGAGGRPKPQSFKRKMKSAQPRAAAAAAAGGESLATPLKTPLMSRLLRRRRRMGVVELNRKLRKRWPPQQGRLQPEEGVARVVPGPSH